MGVLVRTRAGRYVMLAVTLLAVVVLHPQWTSGGMPGPSGDGRSHRAPTTLRGGMVITLTGTWPAASKPSSMFWAIGHAVTDIPPRTLPDVPPVWTQSLIYNPQARYEIALQGRFPLLCKIMIDGVPADQDVSPVGTRAKSGEVHCWINAA